MPLYFAQIRHVPAAEILAHRIVWSTALLLAVCLIGGLVPRIIEVFATRRKLATLALSSLFLALNWLLYIYATVTNRISEASLGYSMLPLVNALLATLILGERLRPAHVPALLLIGCGVLLPLLYSGDFTWLAITLPVSFAFYGLVRKVAPVDSLTGLTVESLLMAVPSLCYLGTLKINGSGIHGVEQATDLWLMAGAIVTVAPLLTFALSVRRLPLMTNSFIQFVSPTVQLLIAIYWIGERITTERWVAMGFVWSAVVIFLADAAWELWRLRRTTLGPEPAS
jgi:chloramphenicol-sensitive protein RarD